MTDPVFDSRTARFGLPLLFAGQAQKEGYVNECAARIDSLLHCAVESDLSSPPATSVDGQCWLIGANATGEWAGKDGHIAARQGGNWLYFAPRDGMRLLNRATGQEIRYNSGWQVPAKPSQPAGGAVIDAEARTVIAAIITSLATAGIVSLA